MSDNASQPNPAAQHDAADSAQDDAPSIVPSGRAPLRRGWVIKVLIFLFVCVGVSIWAYVDAVIVYPARGERVASFYEYQYLGAYALANNGNMTGAPIADPAARWEELDTLIQGGTTKPTDVQQMAYSWLEALRVIGELKPERTALDNPNPPERLEALHGEWQSETAPKPLKGYDIPSQWIILAIFAGLAGYNLFLLGRASMTRYAYDPDAKRLEIPGGSFTPDDIDEIDKRKWDKFIILVTLGKTAQGVGGQTVRFDTYRHDHLETWLLEMEATAFADADEVVVTEPEAEASATEPA